MEQQRRYFFIDGIRGAAIVNMVAFHFCYDMFIVCGKNPMWYDLPYAHIWQQMICQAFIFISGFVWQWGRKGNVRRGIFLNLLGFGITLMTLVFMPREAVWFGILNFLGCAVLLMFPMEKAVGKAPLVPGFAVSILLFIFCKQIQNGYIGIEHFFQIGIPEVLYSIKILTPFGFPYAGFRSSDFFPILPWIFLYLGGYFAGRIFEGHKEWHDFACQKIPVLSDLGGKSIWIYLIHQPVAMLVCMVLFY